MGKRRRSFKRLLNFGPRARPTSEIEDELRFHLEARIAHLVARGRTPEQAREEALARVGPSLRDAAEALRASALRRDHTMQRRQLVRDLTSDLRFATRSLLRRPGFTLLAVLTLAIGIGANTAIFSAVRALLLRPLPFAQPEQLLNVTFHKPVGSTADRGSDPLHLNSWSYPTFAAYRDQQRSFADVAAWSDAQATVTEGEAERLVIEEVSARYLATLRVLPVLGRDFSPTLDRDRGVREVLITHAFWQRRYNGDSRVVGTTLSIDREAHEIIGVLPAGFSGLSGRAEFLLPIARRTQDALSQEWGLEFSVVGRLRAGVSIATAHAEAASLVSRLLAAAPDKDADGRTVVWTASAGPLDALRVAAPVRRALFILLGAVGFVLLIACVNIASLLLGRAVTRQREIAIRLAIGAGRGRLVRFLLAESTLIALLGAVASLGVAYGGVRVLATMSSHAALEAQNLSGLGLVGFASIRIDYASLSYTGALAVLIGIICGLAPALQAGKGDLQGQLKSIEGSRGKAHLGPRRVLVFAEVAFAVVLLTGSALMLRSLQRLLSVDSGFDARQVLTVRLSVPYSQIARDSMPGFYDEMLGALRAISGVQSVALGDCPPLNGGCNGTILEKKDVPAPPPGTDREVGVHWVTPEWFSTLRVPLKRGRLVAESDRFGGEKVVVVNEAAARKFWPDEDPIGKRVGVYQGAFSDGATVVGIVGDVRFATLADAPQADVFLPYAQSPQSRMMIYLRSPRAPSQLIPEVRRVIQRLSPLYPAFDIRTLEERTALASIQSRTLATMLSLFAAVALVLAVIGVYGVIAFSVANRVREIAVRMALGADRYRIQGMIIGEALRVVGLGLVVGLALAFALSRFMSSLLYEVRPNDVMSYVAISALLLATVMLACWMPAQRAARTPPAGVLRSS